MGSIHAKIRLGNPLLKETGDVEVRVLVDNSLPWLRLPAPLVAELGLEAYGHRWLTTAEGDWQSCRYVGPLAARFGNRMCFCGAVEFGTVARLGYLIMDELELAVDSANGVLHMKPSPTWQPADEAELRRQARSQAELGNED